MYISSSSIEVDEAIISSKAPDWKPLLKIKIEQNLLCSNKEYNPIFKNIRQNSRVYTGVKKLCIYQWLGKYYCILGRIWARKGVGEQMWFVPNTVAQCWGTAQHNPSLDTVFPTAKATQNLYINTNIYSFENCQFYHELDPSLSLSLSLSLSYKNTMPEGLSSKSDKIESQGDFQNVNFSTL